MNQRLILPGVLPSVNHMYDDKWIKGRKYRVLSLDAAKWESNIILIAQAWRGRKGWQTAAGKTIVRLWYYWPDARKRDTHNTLKLLLDCFEKAGIYENDQRALPRIMDYDIDRANPRVEVEFELHESARTTA